MTRIVGLGASAGGLQPLEEFFSQVQPGSGMAYIVVQHMDPTHKGMLSELLQRVTSMPVREAAELIRVLPDVVYVIPPNTELTVVNGVIHLAEPVQPRGLRLPIDVLFGSLARDQGENAIGVLLSGMGTDGTLGMQEIKSQGGLTLVQQPESAQFDSMPRSALAAGCVDIIAPAWELPASIQRVVSSQEPGLQLTADPTAGQGAVADGLLPVFELVRNRTKHDLSLYKSSTLRRRIERRMAVHSLGTLDAYVAFLRENPQEIDYLFREMLIGVTGFFRDPEVWQELKDQVLPDLLARRPPEANHLRAWVVGCSTGEEAYSLAIVFREVLEALPEARACSLQIFATDLNADAIAIARTGRYPAEISADVSAERLARFFTPQVNGFLIEKSIREMVLFAQHDVILDPPFTKLEILSCRNLMIYFNAALQRRLVPLFHYSLLPGGVLVLGGSETVGRWHALFTPFGPKSKIYRRGTSSSPTAPMEFPVKPRTAIQFNAQESTVSQSPGYPPNLQTLADQVLLRKFSPPAVLVNQSGDIVYINGRTGRYLEPAAGKANWNIHVMAHPDIRTQLTVALRTVLKEQKTIEIEDLRLKDYPQHMLNITLQSLDEPKRLAGLVMIVFRELDAPSTGRSRGKRAAAMDKTLSAELERAREEMRALREEMNASQEELQAANEELQSTNEELQSANEELTTSKEEAQSMNEELQTINNELQTRLDELALAQSDMQNLLNSTDIATLFLDNDLNVRRFTEQVTRVIHLRESDIGRPLSDLASTLVYPQLYADVKETLRTLAFCERQIPTTDGHWYSMRIMPYRTLNNVIQGAVITFIDISAAKELESRLRKG